MPKTKSQAKSKPKAKKPITKVKLRTKAAKILFLKRSAAGKSRSNRAKLQLVAGNHFIIFTLGLIGLLIAGGYATAMADDLIPPSGSEIDITAFERSAAANRAPYIKPPDQTGVASWYALGLRSPDALTCASTKYPRGTYLQVTDLRNGRQVTCLVNDYGPAAGTNRVIDLSRGTYRQLEGLGSGTLPAEIRVVSGP